MDHVVPERLRDREMVVRYVSRAGQSRFHGGSHLKGSQAYPAGFLGVYLYQNAPWFYLFTCFPWRLPPKGISSLPSRVPWRLSIPKCTLVLFVSLLPLKVSNTLSVTVSPLSSQVWPCPFHGAVSQHEEEQAFGS